MVYFDFKLLLLLLGGNALYLSFNDDNHLFSRYICNMEFQINLKKLHLMLPCIHQ